MNGLRRGACPGVTDPMSTGDGLLTRLVPTEPIAIDRWIALCAASARCGNGVMEVTQRGNLQVRGLSPASASAFAQAVTDLGIATHTRPVILTSPLLGLSAEEHVDLRGFVATLRSEFGVHDIVRSLSPKVSVLIEGRAALHLDDVAADVRVQVGDDAHLHLALGADAGSSIGLGWVEPRRAIEAVMGILTGIADLGPTARGRDLVRDVALTSLRRSLACLLLPGPAPMPRPPADPVGTHELKDGRIARGIALAFGYTHAVTLERLALTAARYGATSFRPSPGRAVLAIGLPANAANRFADAAAAEGFIVQSDDVRRHVVACAGMPACGSATLDTRRLAPAIARAAGPYLDGSVTIHLSGCAKGCAHPNAASLTLVGPDGIVVRGRAGDRPHGTISPANFIAGVPRLSSMSGAASARERSADAIARIGAKAVVEAIGGEPAHD